MRRFLSWVVLYLICCLTSLVEAVACKFGAYLLYLVNELSVFWRLVAYLFGGVTFLSIITLPIHYGSYFSFSASEAIAPSKKGTRYIVFSVYMLIISVIYTILEAMNGTFHASVVLMCIYYITLIVLSRDICSQDADAVDKN